jgi:hypothetical protein
LLIYKNMGNRYENFEAEYDKKRNYETILEYGKNFEIPEPKDFTEIYSRGEIGKDLNYLRLTEKKIEDDNLQLNSLEKGIFEENKKRAECLEIILTDQIYDGDWFGEYAMTSKTSKYDDIKNGVDMVVEFDKEEPERIALAIDASTASNSKVIEEKVEKNMKKLKNKDYLQEVKYFKSQIRDEKGEYYKGGLRDLIPVVVGADRGNVDNLFETFSELKSLEKVKSENAKERRQELRKELAKNPLQGVFLKEIKIQLETYKKFLENKNEKVVNQCDSLLKIIDEVIEEKEKKEIYFKEAMPNDQTFENIREVCRKLT